MEIDQIKRMYDVVKVSSNPSAMIQAMASSNPNLKNVISELSTLNGNPKDVFYAKAREKGMNDEQIDNFLKQLRTVLNV